MDQVDLGKSANEIFVQFMYRILKELPNSLLCCFAYQKYVVSQAFEKFRADLFQPEYKSGFVFPSSSFSGPKGDWPVSFLLWDLAKKIPLDGQNITVDVYHYDKE